MERPTYIILYNPNSTGDSMANAEVLVQELTSAGIVAAALPTEHADHAEELGRQFAKDPSVKVVISASGDGGYHDLINGVLTVLDTRLSVAVLPSGNANDHATVLQQRPLAEALIDHKPQKIDLIKIQSTIDGKPWTRYAHSYAGIGVSAIAAHRITKERPSKLTEKWIVLHSLVSFHSVKLRRLGKVRRYSSVVFGNIGTMSKVIKVSEEASVFDGKFEVSVIRFRSKFRLLAYLFTAASVGLKVERAVEKYELETVRKTPIQVDGESFVIDAGAALTFESAPGALRCLF